MASDDVIELGSSDEETEPAQKKRKLPPNATVQFPNKLPGLTVTAAKSSPKLNPACIIKGAIGKSVTVTKVPRSNIVTNPYATKTTTNGKPMRINPPVRHNVPPPLRHKVSPPVMKHVSIPIMNKMNNIPILTLKRPGPQMKTMVSAVNMNKLVKPNMLPKSVNVDSSSLQPIKTLSALLPGITVKKTTSKHLPQTNLIKRKSSADVGVSKIRLKEGLVSNNEVLSVELDDDEVAPSSGPQWYLRPEEQKAPEEPMVKIPDMETSSTSEVVDQCSKDISEKARDKNSQESLDEASPHKTSQKSLILPKANLEEENNKEPTKTNYIEITIEDSPVKPISHKKGFVVGAELAITIDDSPIKSITEKIVPETRSDEEESSPKERNSKKKLQYPRDIDMAEAIEIEIEPIPVQSIINMEDNTKQLEEAIESTDIVEIEESPIKPPVIEQSVTPKKNKLETPTLKEISCLVDDGSEKAEFHPVYQSFINLCFQLENSDDMKKIVEKKIKSYYRQVPKEYTGSEMFTDMVLSKISAMKASPEKMYLYIKDVVDELNLQRKMAKSQLLTKEIKNEEQEKFLYGEESEFDSKRQRQIRKLEKTLKKLNRAIKKLEDEEVDFDDEDDSVYLLTESGDATSSKDSKVLNKEALIQRYKERIVRVHAKFCQLTNTKMPSEPRVQLDTRPGQPKGPARRLEKLINKKVPIGAPLPFPDFQDVLRCVREANQEDKIGWNETEIMIEASDLFLKCGKKLKRRRQENEWRLATSRIQAGGVDPAEDSEDLKKKLEQNKRLAAEKESEVFDKYADRQKQLKLEAVEIGDKEAEESPVESDDEDPGENKNTSLDSEEKRKERLKIRVQDKSKKLSEEKENHPGDKTVEDKTSQNETETENLIIMGTNIKENDRDEPGTRSDKEPLESNFLNKQLNILPKDVHNKKNCEDKADKVQSLSDDSDILESNIDELHLLQRKCSMSDNKTSSTYYSDTDTSIIVSDASISSVNNMKQLSDVISIENSSYSESEVKQGESSNDKIESSSDKESVENTANASMVTECSDMGIIRTTQETNNEECSELSDGALLGLSDDGSNNECIDIFKENGADSETCINLRDDTISIGDTIIEDDPNNGSEEPLNAEKISILDASSVESIEMGTRETHCETQNSNAENVETSGIKSTNNGSIADITSVNSMEDNEETKEPEPKIPEQSLSATTVNESDTASINNTKSVEDSITMSVNNRDSNQTEEESRMEITEKTDRIHVQKDPVEETKDKASIPEPMEVDDISA